MKDKNQQGNVLIYALLTIAAILSTTIVISNFVMSTIKQAGSISNAQAAFYAGESGIEKALYSIRKNDLIPDDGDCNVALDCELEVDDQTVSELSLDLAKNQTVQFDLFNPDNNNDPLGVESVGLTWSSTGTWLEVTYVAWDSATTIKWFSWDPAMKAEDLNVQKMLYNGGSAIINSFSGNKNYRVRVKALYGDVDDLEIKLFSLDNKHGQQLVFPNYLNIKTTGSFRDANQSLSAQMPRYAPVLGLFDYVLFSEEALEK